MYVSRHQRADLTTQQGGIHLIRFVRDIKHGMSHQYETISLDGNASAILGNVHNHNYYQLSPDIAVFMQKTADHDWKVVGIHGRTSIDRWGAIVSRVFWERNIVERLSVNDMTLRQECSHGFQIISYKRSTVLLKWVQDDAIFWGGGEELPEARLIELKKQHRNCIAAVASQLRHIDSTQWESRLQPKLVRTLDCIGYFYEELEAEGYDRFSYAFLLPSHLQTIMAVNVKTLKDYLVEFHEPPNVGARTKLAKALTQTIFGIHHAGLFHKSFNADNIIFLGKEDDSGGTNIPRSIDEPHVVGYELARPHSRPDFSVLPVESDIYAHPAYNVSQNFSIFFDIHSLGLVLLSIGLWRTLESFWEEFITKTYGSQHSLGDFTYSDLFSKAKENGHQGNHGSLKWQYVEFILDKSEGLSASCGTEWASAVEWCTKTAWQKEYSTKAFLENVLHCFDR